MLQALRDIQKTAAKETKLKPVPAKSRKRLNSAIQTTNAYRARSFTS